MLHLAGSQQNAVNPLFMYRGHQTKNAWKLKKKFWAAPSILRARTIKHGGGNYAAARGTEKKCGEGPSIEQINAAAAAPREIFIHTGCAAASAIFILIVPRPPITHALNRSQLHKNASLPTNTARWSALLRAQPNYILWFVFPTDWLSSEYIRNRAPASRKQLMVRCARSVGKKMVFYGRKVMFVAHLRGWWVFIFFHPRCGKQPKVGFLWSLERFSSQLHRAFLVCGEKLSMAWWFERAGYV